MVTGSSPAQAVSIYMKKLAVSYGGWCTKYWLTAGACPGKVLLGKLPAGDIAQNGADEGVKPEQTNKQTNYISPNQH